MATYSEIQAELKAPIPAAMLKQRQQGGQTLTFLPWYNCSALADERAPGWSGEARVQDLGDAVAVVYRITVKADDGDVAREAIGYEAKSTSSYGDPTSNAEAMAFRRAWAKHGLGSSLYGGDSAPALASSGGSATFTPAAGGSVGGWNGMLWYGSCKGKHYTDPSVDVKSLQWGADNAKNRDGSPNEPQREALRAEIARRQGGGSAPAQAAPVATFTAPADSPSAPDKVSTGDLQALMQAAKAAGKNWAHVKETAQTSFSKDPAALSRDEYDLLLMEINSATV